MTLIDMIKMEMDIRIEKLKQFEKVAEKQNNGSDYARFYSRRLELESMKFFIDYHGENNDK